MLSGLAGKLFGTITTTTTNGNKMEDSGDGEEVVVATASQDQEELSDSEEWVLLDDDEVSDRGSILDELELVVNNSSPSNDDSSSLNFSPNSDGWNVEPPSCFQNRQGGGEKQQQEQQKGKNKYKNTTKHKNPNLQRSIQKQHQQKTKDFRIGVKKRPPPKTNVAAGGDVVVEGDGDRKVNDFDDVMDVSVLENMLIECPAPAMCKVKKCADRTTTGDVLRPLTSNNNQAAITPTTPITAEKAAPARKALSANTTDRPLRPPPFKRQVKVTKSTFDGPDDDKKENKAPQPSPRGVATAATAPTAPSSAKKAASKSNLTYVITGLSVCAMKPCPTGAAAAAALTLAQQPPPLPMLQDRRAAAAVATTACAPHMNRRGGMKRQNFTVYDASLFGKGKQRKDRIKNFSGRSNDRRRQ